MVVGASIAINQSYGITNSGAGYFSGITVGSDAATWKSMTLVKITGMSNAHYFLYSTGSGDTTPSGVAYGKLISASTEVTIHYLGY